MAVTYTILNAAGLALISVFALGIHMIFRFRNQYVAIIAPVVILYVITFVFDSTMNLYQYNIRMILQPRATSALTILITTSDVVKTFAVWVLVDFIFIMIGFVRNRDII